MPFTFSHPAIVLPFYNSKKNPFSVTGLVIGSIVPDFEFLLRLKETNCFGHTWLGIVAFDIPFGLLLSFIFHKLTRNSLLLHLPKCLRERFSAFAEFDWTRYFMQNKTRFFISMLVGIFSHIFIDAFTHVDGFIAVQHPSFFKEIAFFTFSLPLYYILQLSTSLLGAIYIVWLVLKMRKSADLPQINNRVGYWLNLAGLGICILVVRLNARHTAESFEDIIIAIVGSFCYATIVVSLVYFKKGKIGNKKSPGVVQPGDQ